MSVYQDVELGAWVFDHTEEHGGAIGSIRHVVAFTTQGAAESTASSGRCYACP